MFERDEKKYYTIHSVQGVLLKKAIRILKTDACEGEEAEEEQLRFKCVQKIWLNDVIGESRLNSALHFTSQCCAVLCVT